PPQWLLPLGRVCHGGRLCYPAPFATAPVRRLPARRADPRASAARRRPAPGDRRGAAVLWLCRPLLPSVCSSDRLFVGNDSRNCISSRSTAVSGLWSCIRRRSLRVARLVAF